MNKDLPFDSWDWLAGATVKVAIAHGTANAKRVIEDIKAGGPLSECHFIEFMACPGGCLGGGGMPIPTSPEIRAARAKAIYAEDAAYNIRKSHENPAVAKLYQEFLTDGPCGHTAHHLLHTHYTPRGKYIA
jgi:NADH-quinone oxidoreductase subunit G/[NiFe] hydrogenase diaphorase moiety small subunit